MSQALDVTVCQSNAPGQVRTCNLTAGADEPATVTATPTGTALTVAFTGIAPWELFDAAASVSVDERDLHPEFPGNRAWSKAAIA